MSANRKIRRVKVMIDLEYSVCRDMLTGISEYIKRHRCLWQISLHTHTNIVNASLFLILDELKAGRETI